MCDVMFFAFFFGIWTQWNGRVNHTLRHREDRLWLEGGIMKKYKIQTEKRKARKIDNIYGGMEEMRENRKDIFIHLHMVALELAPDKMQLR